MRKAAIIITLMILVFLISGCVSEKQSDKEEISKLREELRKTQSELEKMKQTHTPSPLPTTTTVSSTPPPTPQKTTLPPSKPAKDIIFFGDPGEKMKNFMWKKNLSYDIIDPQDQSIEVTVPFLQNYKMIIWPSGSIYARYLSTGELDTIKEFINQGGNLLIGVPRSPFYEEYNTPFLRTFGISMSDIVSDYWSNYASYPHPISKNISGTLYWRLDYNMGRDHATEVLEIKPPAKPIFWIGDKDPNSYALLAVSEYGKGKVCVVGGQSSLGTLRHIDEGDTNQLLSNIISWFMTSG